jgi:peroxiredoxin
MDKATVLVTGMALLGILSIGLTAMLYQLVKQQGRLLLRLDQVERQLGIDPSRSIERGTVRLQSRNPAGLPVGTLLPDFELPDLEGRQVPSKEFRGRKVLLVNWNARCGFCDLIAPDLARLGPDFERRGVQLLLLSQATAEAERELLEEHGLKAPVLLQSPGSVPEVFDSVGTPAAYLLDEEGRIAKPLAVGSDRVLALSQELVAEARKRARLPEERPLSESRIERDGLKAGTPAPAFTLPDTRGGTVSLDQYRGRKVLLVFSDPHCGPCDQLAPHLIHLDEQHRNNGLSVVMIGRGEPAENQRKANEHGFRFPVALQRKWEISRRYGIFAMPAGFLIDESGIVAREVATGVDSIVALASTIGRQE